MRRHLCTRALILGFVAFTHLADITDVSLAALMGDSETLHWTETLDIGPSRRVLVRERVSYNDFLVSNARPVQASRLERPPRAQRPAAPLCAHDRALVSLQDMALSPSCRDEL
jgi:hypothetical protein